MKNRRVRKVVWILVVCVALIGLNSLSARLGYGSLHLLPRQNWGFGVHTVGLALDGQVGVPTVVIPVRRDIDLGPVSWQTPIPIDRSRYETKLR